MMRAVAYKKYGQPRDVVSIHSVARPPAPGPGQLLVKVTAASLNPADYKSAQGDQRLLLTFKWPRVYGFDFCGAVVEVGESAEVEADSPEKKFRPGDRVFGMIQGLPERDRGTLAEYVLVESRVCALAPAGIPSADCASVPLVGITAVKMFRACEGLKAKPRVLVTGGSGGMGTMCIQLAKVLYGASFVACTATSPGPKADLCKSLGADLVVNYRDADWPSTLRAKVQEPDSSVAGVSDDGLFDVILDCSGCASKCVTLLRKDGSLVSILAGPTQKALQTWIREARVDPERATVGVYSFLQTSATRVVLELFTGARSLQAACAARGGHFAHVIGTGNGEIVQILADLLATGKLRAVIDKVYELDEAVDAIEYLRTGRAAGKVLVRICHDEVQ